MYTAVRSVVCAAVPTCRGRTLLPGFLNMMLMFACARYSSTVRTADSTSI